MPLWNIAAAGTRARSLTPAPCFEAPAIIAPRPHIPTHWCCLFGCFFFYEDGTPNGTRIFFNAYTKIEYRRKVDFSNPNVLSSRPRVCCLLCWWMFSRYFRKAIRTILNMNDGLQKVGACFFAEQLQVQMFNWLVLDVLMHSGS